MFRKICAGLVALGLTTQAFAGYQMTPRQAFYYHAHKGNISALQKIKALGHSVDISDSQGNSALCESVYRYDYSAFAMLKQMGATIGHPCVSKIPQQTIQQFNQGYTNWAKAVNSGKIAYAGTSTKTATATTAEAVGTTATATVATTTGLSTAAMVGIGVGAVALIGGGIALASGGGGGSGGDSSSSAPVECSGRGVKDASGNCSCNSGWTGDNCENKDSSCKGSSTPISNCSAQTSCKYGDQTLYNCTTCNTGYTGTACNTCASGYGKHGTNECLLNLGCNTAHGYQSGSSCVCEEGWTGDNLCDTATACGTNYVAQCPAGYTYSQTCKSGDNTLKLCDTCATGYKKIGGVCVREIDCNGHGTQTGDGVCTCNTGWDASTNCASCDSAHTLIGGSCVTKLNCQNGSTQISATKCSCSNLWTGDLCDSCPISGEHVTNCACDSGYTQSGSSCVDSSIITCSTNQYWNGSSCQACPVNSASSGGSDTTCECNSGFTNLGNINTACFAITDCNGHGTQTGDAMCSCTGGYTGDLCDVAPVSCTTSQYWDGTSCKDCLNGGTSYGGQDRLCSCPGYWNGRDCGTCDLGSENVNTATCECNPGYEEDHYRCVKKKCPGTMDNNIANCKTISSQVCYSGSDAYYTCDECDDGYYWTGKYCAFMEEYNPCEDEEITNTSLNGCSRYDTCNRAGGTVYFCSICQDGFNPMDDGSCQSCPKNTYFSYDWQCEPCPPNSTSEGGSVRVCTCNAGYIMQNGRCVAEATTETSGTNMIYKAGADTGKSVLILNSDETDNNTHRLDGAEIYYGMDTGEPSRGVEDGYGYLYSTAQPDKQAIIKINDGININHDSRLTIPNIFGANTSLINRGNLTLTNWASAGIVLVSRTGMAQSETDKHWNYSDGLYNYGNINIIGDSLFSGIEIGTDLRSYDEYWDEVVAPDVTAPIDTYEHTGTFFNNGTININDSIIGVTLSTYSYYDEGSSLHALFNPTTGTNNGTISCTDCATAVHVYYSKFINNGTISLDQGSALGTARGIFATNSTIINGKDGKIQVNAQNGWGIQATDSVVYNYGTIDFTNSEIYEYENVAPETIYSGGGISLAGENAKLYNEGTIKINSTILNVITGEKSTLSQSSVGSYDQPFVQLSAGAQILTSGILDASTNSLNLASFSTDGTGKVVALPNAQFKSETAIKDDLYLSNDFVTNNFDTTVVAKDMIQTPDASKLNLISESALFDAKLADNGSDVVMKMKNFTDVVPNKSLAQFLANNYALANNAEFYNKLKSFDNLSSLNNSLNKLTGQDMLSRFNFEDMTMMRELNFDMNDKLFHNKEQSFSLSGSVSPMAFKGDTGSNARYSLYNKRNGNTSVGFGVAFTNVRSDDDKDDNNRQETMYQMVMPFGYKTGNLNMVISPRIGYARGTYDRTGFDGSTYDGTIEKRVFGVMNEARYPIQFAGWNFEPTVEFNVLGYQQKGSEEAKQFSLRIPNQNTLSVESGLGFYANKETQLQDGKLNLNAGLMLYHEFANPYKLNLTMNGMVGKFEVKDENRSQNRAVARAGFDYNKDNLSLYGNFMSYIDREWRTNAKTGFKWKF